MIVEDGCFFHVTWRCHNRDWLLDDERAKKLYYDLLLKYKDRYGIQIHAYHLMENHIHIAGRMDQKEAFSAFFRVVNNLFARRRNRKLKRCGQVVMDRFKSPMIQDDCHMMRVMTYIDLNGVRCGRDNRPGDQKWSSYGYYAYGDEDPLITPSPSYLELGTGDKERQQVYRGMVKELMKQEGYNISGTCFIGDPDWVKARYEQLRTWLLAAAERQGLRMGLDPPR